MLAWIAPSNCSCCMHRCFGTVRLNSSFYGVSPACGPMFPSTSCPKILAKVPNFESKLGHLVAAVLLTASCIGCRTAADFHNIEGVRSFQAGNQQAALQRFQQ